MIPEWHEQGKYVIEKLETHDTRLLLLEQQVVKMQSLSGELKGRLSLLSFTLVALVSAVLILIKQARWQ